MLLNSKSENLNLSMRTDICEKALGIVYIVYIETGEKRKYCESEDRERIIEDFKNICALIVQRNMFWFPGIIDCGLGL